MKIYLAGPDVFRPDVAEWAESVRELCRRYGFEPLLPVDHNETTPDKIYQSNIDLIRKAQIVVANLDPFRGPEPDSGTAFELGYALALGKKICGYVTRLETVAQRVEIFENRSESPAPYGDKLTDRNGLMIENFGLPCNLMLSIPANIVEGGLEACLQTIRSRPPVVA
jgi:nucleoside 2-deoxyribosyltransferase